MNRILLSLIAAISALCSVQAGSDVTSQYLVNADFSAGPVTTVNIITYSKDVTGDEVHSFQGVNGWTVEVLGESNGVGSGDGMAGGVLAYSSSNTISSVAAPSQGPGGSGGHCLGIVAVWTCGAYYYQEVTLPAGEYTLTFPVYNSGTTRSYTSYIGFMADDGTRYTADAMPQRNAWTELTTTFTLSKPTRGRVMIGYQSSGGGSAEAPYLFFDRVKLEQTVWTDCTQYLQNPGFDEDISFNNDGSAAKEVTLIYDWDECKVFKSADGSVYSLDNNGQQGVNAAGQPNWDGFKASIRGWETTNKVDTVLWIYYGVIPYDLGDDMMMLGTEVLGNGNVVEKPAAIATDDNTGVLYLKAGWRNACTYKQTVRNLPQAKYRLTYYIRNTNVDRSYKYVEADNLCNVTCNGVTFADNEGFNSRGWIKHSIDFIPVDSFSVEFGCRASNDFSYNNPILWVDGIELFRTGEATDSEVDEAYGRLVGQADSLVAAMHFAADKRSLQQAISTFASDKDYVALYHAIAAAEASEEKYRQLTADDGVLAVVAGSLQAEPSAYGSATAIVSYACSAVSEWLTDDRATSNDADRYTAWLDACANSYAPAYVAATAFVDSLGADRAKNVQQLMLTQSFMLTSGAMAGAEVVVGYAGALRKAMVVAQNDINGDGAVDIGDIMAIIDVMSGQVTDAATVKAADLNGDEAADIGDIVTLIDIMASLAGDDDDGNHEGILL